MNFWFPHDLDISLRSPPLGQQDAPVIHTSMQQGALVRYARWPQKLNQQQQSIY
jgi:hypothetical protein